jgi:hypothetical protein
MTVYLFDQGCGVLGLADVTIGSGGYDAALELGLTQTRVQHYARALLW